MTFVKQNNKGQMVVEMILVMLVMLAVFGAVKTGLKNNEAFQTLVQGPWRVLSGMIIAGSWLPPDQAVEKHPALDSNHGSLRGSDP